MIYCYALDSNDINLIQKKKTQSEKKITIFIDVCIVKNLHLEIQISFCSFLIRKFYNMKGV